MRLRNFRWIDFVMFRDGAMDTEFYGLRFSGEYSGAQGTPLALYPNVGHVNDFGHVGLS